MAKKKARVLVDAVINDKPVRPNDVITVDDQDLKALAGVVDVDPEAVKYAESLSKAENSKAD
jgi:hypothetical protein